MEKLFRTARLKDEYNLLVSRDEAGHLHVTLDQGSVGHTVVLSGFEVTGFISAISELQPTEKPETPSDGIPPHEPSTCGTACLASERALRVIEKATMLGESMSADAIEAITNLAHEAGAACNRIALRRDAFGDELPF